MSVRRNNLELELLEPGAVSLVRLFNASRVDQPGGQWDPPPEAYRNLRVDPPGGHKSAYAVLYTADTLPCVAAECKVLWPDHEDHWYWAADQAEKRLAVRYRFAAPALFIPIDHNDERLGLAGHQRAFAGYAPYQEAALKLFTQFGALVHGLSWRSFHRNQSGRVYALWHHHKASLKLEITSSAPYPRLVDDHEWRQFLLDNPRSRRSPLEHAGLPLSFREQYG